MKGVVLSFTRVDSSFQPSPSALLKPAHAIAVVNWQPEVGFQVPGHIQLVLVRARNMKAHENGTTPTAVLTL